MKSISFKTKKLEDRLADLTLKVVMKNIIISAQALQIKALKEKLNVQEEK